MRHFKKVNEMKKQIAKILRKAAEKLSPGTPLYAIEKYDLIEYSIDDYAISGHLYVSEKEGKCLE